MIMIKDNSIPELINKISQKIQECDRIINAATAQKNKLIDRINQKSTARRRLTIMLEYVIKLQNTSKEFKDAPVKNPAIKKEIK